MCLPGLCPGDRFDRMGAHLDDQIAKIFQADKPPPPPAAAAAK